MMVGGHTFSYLFKGSYKTNLIKKISSLSTDTNLKSSLNKNLPTSLNLTILR